MIHPVELPLHLSWLAISIVVVRRVQKQSVSNAFQYVVLHPAAPHISMCLIAARADSSCKDTKYYRDNSQHSTFLTFVELFRGWLRRACSRSAK